MNAYIFGDYTKWNNAVKLLKKYRSDICICACCDPFRPQLSEMFKAAITTQEMGDNYFSGYVDSVIVPDATTRELNDFLQRCGMPNYAIGSKYYHMNCIDEVLTDKIIQPYGDIEPELSQIEFHLADHCNLNCAGCAHFSNLVTNPVFADFEQFSKDIRRLNELFSYIAEFYLLGGEPLLNKDISKYMIDLRNVFPYTKITVVSNGLLVMNMSEELIKTFIETQSELSISNYNCLDTKKISDFLEKSNINYEIRYGRDYFAKYLSEKADDDINDVFEKCPNRKCHFLGKGMMAVCGQPFYIKYFNDFFGEHFCDEGAISLYDENIDGNKILSLMNAPIGACKNCTYLEPVEWRVTDGTAKKSDWCVK